MNIEIKKCGSLTKKGTTDPIEHTKRVMQHTDTVIKFFKEIKPGDLSDYATNLKIRLDEVIGNYRFERSLFDWKNLRENLVVLTDFPDLEESVFNYIVKTIQLPDGYELNQEEIELKYIDLVKSVERLSYHRVKTITEMFVFV